MRNNLCECPALQPRKRLGLNDANAVSNLTLVALVMHVVFLGAFDDLVEFRVGNAGDVFDDEGLVHFIGNDHANTGFTKVDLCVRRSLAHGSSRWDLEIRRATWR